MTKITATKRAKALQKIMGSKWDICVWENLGWHYKLLSKTGYITLCVGLSGDHKSNYCCMISVDMPGTGLPGWFSSEFFKDPHDAVFASLKVFRHKLNQCQQNFNNLLYTLGL